MPNDIKSLDLNTLNATPRSPYNDEKPAYAIRNKPNARRMLLNFCILPPFLLLENYRNIILNAIQHLS